MLHSRKHVVVLFSTVEFSTDYKPLPQIVKGNVFNGLVGGTNTDGEWRQLKIQSGM